MASDRYFENHFRDYNSENYFQSNGEILDEIRSKMCRWIDQRLELIDQHTNTDDSSVYTGVAGIALLYHRLSSKFVEREEFFKSKATSNIDRALARISQKRMTFLCGAPGVLATAAVISNDEKIIKKCVDNIVAIRSQAFDLSMPDEFLYGRAGYLYTLMFIRENLRPDLIDPMLITDVFQTIIKSGENYSRKISSNSPLMFQWHDKEYLGAAHGLCGIIYLLLKVANDNAFAHLHPFIASHLIPTVRFLKQFQFDSGNFRSSISNGSDRLVQWCHGATGFVFLFTRAFEITGEKEYLDWAFAAGDTIWQRGLLRKGYGLCHGTAGNGYVFLHLFRITNDQKWLHRALKFAEHCLNDENIQLSQTPDHPYSLFEGLAGAIYFVADVLSPYQAQFPGFS